MRALAQVAPPPSPAPLAGWRAGLAYAGLAMPLAFVSLPLYVSLPYHYATSFGAPLALLGAVVMAVRALDAVVDPALGRLADRLFERGAATAWRAAALGALLLALSFAALWQPTPGAPALAWLAACLLLCTLAYSGVSLIHQSWGTRWGGGPQQRARVVAWREAGSLAGVLLASALPLWWGWQGSASALPLLLLLGLLGLRGLPPASGRAAETSEAGAVRPWRQAAFRDLLLVFMLNGIAAAVPATLLPFFVADRLQAESWQGLLLLVYFGAAVLGLPFWLGIAARLGLAPAWRASMLASVLAFAATPWLAAGDAAAFALVCLASGLMLGADLALPGALLTGLIHQAGDGQRAEGRYLGWWVCASKLNLALAAGLALPLLALLGYRPGTADAGGLQALAWAYGGLPCVLKLLAAAALWRAERRHPAWRERG